MSINRNLSLLAGKTNAAGVLAGGLADNAVTRSMLSPTAGGTGARNWTFLGQGILPNVTTGADVRTPTVSWSGSFRQLMIEYYIGSYQGGSIGRLVFGTVANTTGTLPGETTATCWCNLSEDNGAVQKTSGTAISGIPTAVTANVGERFGMLNVNNQLGKNKRITGQGQHTTNTIAAILAGTAESEAPISVRHDAIYTITAGQIQQVSLVSYLTITGNVVNGTNFGQGTYINVWGRNDD